jgi:hypothetical protein
VDHLGDVLGQSVVASATLTPARANRKPVLQLLDLRGRTIAFAKIGVNELTRKLVRAETQTLGVLSTARLRRIQSPVVLHAGTWRDLDVLVLSPLPVWQGVAAGSADLGAGMRELAATPVPPYSGTQPVNYARMLIDLASACAVGGDEDDRAVAAQLGEWLTGVESLSRTSDLPLGTWHGDWTPWNCCMAGTDLLVWDWERCSGGVPVGFDALHYALHQAVASHRMNHRLAAVDLLGRAPDTLASWPLSAAQARLVAPLYLVEIGLRYLAEGQGRAGGHGGDVGSWLIPALRTWAG